MGVRGRFLSAGACLSFTKHSSLSKDLYSVSYYFSKTSSTDVRSWLRRTHSFLMPHSNAYKFASPPNAKVAWKRRLGVKLTLSRKGGDFREQVEIACPPLSTHWHIQGWEPLSSLNHQSAKIAPQGKLPSRAWHFTKQETTHYERMRGMVGQCTALIGTRHDLPIMVSTQMSYQETISKT